MGAQNGTYVPWHEPVWSHAKMKRAATVLEESKIPPEYAPLVVARALHALSCWALRDGDTGETGRLSDGELAQIAWPEGVARGRLRPAAIGALLRRALHAGALLVGDGPAEAIHDFADHNRRVLADRERRREERGSPRTRGGQSEDSPRTESRPVGGLSTTRPRLARASGVEAERLRGSEAARGDDASADAAPPDLPSEAGSVGAAPPEGRTGPEPLGDCQRCALLGDTRPAVGRRGIERLCGQHLRGVDAARAAGSPRVESAPPPRRAPQTRRRPRTERAPPVLP